MNVNSCGIFLFYASVSFLLRPVAIYFSSITELNLFPSDAKDQKKKNDMSRYRIKPLSGKCFLSLYPENFWKPEILDVFK